MTRLDDVLDPRNPVAPAGRARQLPQRSIDRLGVVVGGSLNDGVRIKLDRDTFVEGLAVGSYVTIAGQILQLIRDLVREPPIRS